MAKVNTQIKPPNIDTPMTDQELIEFYKCADPETGYLYFIKNYVWIQAENSKQLFTLWDYQERMLNVYATAERACALCPRQSGKSVSAAAYLLWYSMFIPNSTIIIASYIQKAAIEIMERIKFAYENCPDFLRCGARAYNVTSVTWDNGSRILAMATTENTGRGMSVNLLYLDELAFVPVRVASKMWTSINFTLAQTKGRAIITSTPNSDDDMFATLWKGANKPTLDENGKETGIGVNGFTPFRAYWWEQPGRDETWKQKEIASVGLEKFKRDIECEFIISDDLLIDSMKLAALSHKEPILQEGHLRWYREPNPKYSYIVALDPSVGVQRDPAAIQVWELPTMEQVAEWSTNKVDIPGQIRIFKSIIETIYDTVQDKSKIMYSIENNGVGEAALQAILGIGEENFMGTFLHEPKRNSGARHRGFYTSPKEKLIACSKFKNYIEHNKMFINSKYLLSELKTFIATENSFKAKPGDTDDLVMATLLVVRMIEYIKTYDMKTFSALQSGDEMIMPMPFVVF